MDIHAKDGRLISVNHLLFSEQDLTREDDWFTRFYVDDFLPEKFDFHLRKTFPSSILTSLGTAQLTTTASYNDPLVADFVSQSPEWSCYFNAILSEEFLQNLLSVFRQEIRNRYPLAWRWILAPRVFNPKNLETTALFSASRRGFHLTPHSDDKYKVVSLIHYLPDALSTGSQDAGTRFFVPRNPRSKRRILKSQSNWSRGVRKFLPFSLVPSFEFSLARRLTENQAVNFKETISFNSNFELSDSLEYAPNRLAGFIKNSWSIHEVNLTEFPSDAIRQAIIINVRLKPTKFGSFLDEIDIKLSRIKSRIRTPTSTLTEARSA